CQNDHNYPFTF
nr:immunoglobulin light chain junction region [Mus musculus]NSM02434.1 immunoglobulin light chain junction region [Mus musculus]